MYIKLQEMCYNIRFLLQSEDLDRLSKEDMKKVNYDELLDLCDSLGVRHQDLHKENLMKRKSDNEIVMIDILDDSLPKQDIKEIKNMKYLKIFEDLLFNIHFSN